MAPVFKPGEKSNTLLKDRGEHSRGQEPLHTASNEPFLAVVEGKHLETHTNFIGKAPRWTGQVLKGGPQLLLACEKRPRSLTSCAICHGKGSREGRSGC